MFIKISFIYFIFARFCGLIDRGKAIVEWFMQTRLGNITRFLVGYTLNFRGLVQHFFLCNSTNISCDFRNVKIFNMRSDLLKYILGCIYIG